MPFMPFIKQVKLFTVAWLRISIPWYRKGRRRVQKDWKNKPVYSKKLCHMVKILFGFSLSPQLVTTLQLLFMDLKLLLLCEEVESGSNRRKL